jgi:hypothetical protein
MAGQYVARYAFVMLPRMIALAVALACSLATNIWLATRAPVAAPGATPGVVPGVVSAPVQCEPPDSAQGAPSLTAFSRAVEESKRARAAAAKEAPPEDAVKLRALVDTSVVLDAQCRHARGKAEEAFRREAPGIRRFLLEEDKRTPEELARDLEGKKSELADVIGAEPSDARVQELAIKRFELERAARTALRDAVAGEPPDWRTALDVVLDLYRKQDGEARRILGDEKAQEVMLADVDGRAGVLAIGSSLVGEPWEASAAALPR